MRQAVQFGFSAAPLATRIKSLGFCNRGFSDGDSGDYTELIFLRVKYLSGRIITFDAEHLRLMKTESQFRRGTWWIDDTGVTYISTRDANIRWRHLMR